ncbi:MAG: anthranilate phosphoribosyltransferase [Planctomycetales bacterium]|nr:anthranilate phosphoribosyltransferase [Planctomycetales bacterium]
MIEAWTGRVCAGEDLTRDEMQAAVHAIMQGTCSDGTIAALLTGLAHKGETVEEIAGAADAMRAHMTPVRTDLAGVLDTCGTGGTGSKLLNVSTTAALVAAAAGVPVAKHGNRSVTSRTGSADVLEALGVRIDAPVDVVEACLRDAGICFCFARTLHPAMRHVAPVRAKLGMRTIFNLLGPLSNPAGAQFQLLGTGDDETRSKLASALLLLKVQRAVLVTGEDGLGEATLTGNTAVTIAENGRLEQQTWAPGDFGLAAQSLASLEVQNAAESAAKIKAVLGGERGAARDMILLNAGAALWTAGRDASLARCAEQAAEAIDSGAAADTLARLVDVSNKAADE